MRSFLECTNWWCDLLRRWLDWRTPSPCSLRACWWWRQRWWASSRCVYTQPPWPVLLRVVQGLYGQCYWEWYKVHTHTVSMTSATEGGTRPPWPVLLRVVQGVYTHSLHDQCYWGWYKVCTHSIRDLLLAHITLFIAAPYITRLLWFTQVLLVWLHLPGWLVGQGHVYLWCSVVCIQCLIWVLSYQLWVSFCGTMQRDWHTGCNSTCIFNPLFVRPLIYI